MKCGQKILIANSFLFLCFSPQKITVSFKIKCKPNLGHEQEQVSEHEHFSRSLPSSNPLSLLPSSRSCCSIHRSFPDSSAPAVQGGRLAGGRAGRRRRAEGTCRGGAGRRTCPARGDRISRSIQLICFFFFQIFKTLYMCLYRKYYPYVQRVPKKQSKIEKKG